MVIVGHGLAGATLSQFLLKIGQPVLVVDGNLPHSASGVAAGLVNPFLGPKLNCPPQLSSCLEANLNFHRFIELNCGKSFYEELTLRRIFISAEQRNRWRSKSMMDENSSYMLGEESEKKLESMDLFAPFGAGLTKAFRLLIPKFISYSKQILKKRKSWIDGSFDESEWKNAEKVVFCEGHRVMQNPFFNFLPFSPAQGEILRLKGPTLDPVSNGTWFCPDDDKFGITGSTWKHDNMDCGPTESGRRTILQNLSFLKIDQYEVCGHSSGVRSSTKDRFPIMGIHPKNSRYFLFNGFGSRGATTIAYYAEQMTNFVLRGVKLPKEVCLNRFDDCTS